LALSASLSLFSGQLLHSFDRTFRAHIGRTGASGPISNEDYPYDENEDPFIWKNKRGYLALFHANTWSDSRGAHISVAAVSAHFQPI
jgi:hypothetical protein